MPGGRQLSVQTVVHRQRQLDSARAAANNCHLRMLSFSVFFSRAFPSSWVDGNALCMSLRAVHTLGDHGLRQAVPHACTLCTPFMCFQTDGLHNPP